MNERIGFTCAYAPLPLIHAAGFVPFRILPLGDAPDQAGSLLHDNMCPHVKRVLDRALAPDLPELSGVVFVNSCDAMRRLADAWRITRPSDRTVLIDLPSTNDDGAVRYLATELERLADQLVQWAGRPMTDERVVESTRLYRDLSSRLSRLGERAARGTLPGGRRAVQEAFNRSVTMPVDDSLAEISRLEAAPDRSEPSHCLLPLYLFGNVLPDPDAFDLFEACGATVATDDLCTGSRQIAPLEVDSAENVFVQIARGLLSRPACARTLDEAHPGALAAQVVSGARSSGARGVIAHVVKFCDPYLIRLPAIREALRDAGLPMLTLEGDCTLRSLGQHRTRIEAFVEMLGGGAR